MTNYQHLLTLKDKDLSKVLVNLNREMCLCCPKLRLQECRDNCNAGMRDWLRAEYIPSSYVWKGTEKDG